jgi:hypothetical protein
MNEFMTQNFIEVLIYSGICLALGVIGAVLMFTNNPANELAFKLRRLIVISLVPFIIIFGILAVDSMLIGL